MITSVSLNPSIDRTVEINELNVGGLNRVAAQVDVAAGKGVNVALAVAALGGDSACIGFMYERDHALFRQRLDAQSVRHDFIMRPGSVRVNMKLFDRSAQQITELNAKGEAVDETALESFRASAHEWAGRSSFMILSGSLPPCCPDDFYSTIISDVRDSGCRVILDADDRRLRAGLEAKPYLIKPNRAELEGLAGRKLESTDSLLKAAEMCIKKGCRIVAVSLGHDGALITNGREAYKADGLKIEVKSTVAAGDSMVAGLAVALDRGDALDSAFRLGIAAATARCALAPDVQLSQGIVDEYAERIVLHRL